MDLTPADGATDAPSDDAIDRTHAGHREVLLEREETGTYLARNARGGTLRLSSTGTEDFSPVELLLVALAGCSAVDVDTVTARRVEPTRFVVREEGLKTRDGTGAVMQDLVVSFDVTFPAGEEGDRARTVLPRALRVSHDQECTVSRTVEAGVPVTVRLVDTDGPDGTGGTITTPGTSGAASA